MTIKLYLIVMFAVPLFDAFDRLFARTAFRIDGSSTGDGIWPPNRRICWGIITNVRLQGYPPRDLRFFRMKLPLRTWGLMTDSSRGYSAIYALREHWLEWIEGARLDPKNPYLGWRITPSLE